MNKDRRKRLLKIINEIESIMIEEQDALDNMPESLIGSNRCSFMEEVISNMEEAIDLIKSSAEGGAA